MGTHTRRGTHTSVLSKVVVYMAPRRMHPLLRVCKLDMEHKCLQGCCCAGSTSLLACMQQVSSTGMHTSRQKAIMQLESLSSISAHSFGQVPAFELHSATHPAALPLRRCLAVWVLETGSS